jgi:hypothetical protein
VSEASEGGTPGWTNGGVDRGVREDAVVHARRRLPIFPCKSIGRILHV